MTLHPFDPDELGRTDPELEHVAERIERYAAGVEGQPPIDLSARIRIAIDLEPVRRGLFAGLLGPRSGPLTAVAAAAALVLVVAGVLAIGQFVERTREQIGTSPSPSVIVTPSPSPSPSSSPTPSASDDHGGGVETPEPSETDDGGGSDNSGPGGGGGSGSGSGSSGSGSGSD